MVCRDWPRGMMPLGERGAAGEGRVGESPTLPWPCLLLRDAAQGGSALLHGAC